MYLHTRVFFPCPVPPVPRKKVGIFTIYNNALCGWLILFILGHIFVSEIADQVRQLLKWRKNKGTLSSSVKEALYYMFFVCHLFGCCLQ
jgi:hypothetical protein